MSEGHGVSVLDVGNRSRTSSGSRRISGTTWARRWTVTKSSSIWRRWPTPANPRTIPGCATKPTSRGTLNVLGAALKGNVGRVLVASSSWVSGAQEGEIVNEKSPFNLGDINTVYGASKISQELLCFSFQSEYRGPQVHRAALRHPLRRADVERPGGPGVHGDGRADRDHQHHGGRQAVPRVPLRRRPRRGPPPRAPAQSGKQGLQPDRAAARHHRGDRQRGRQTFPRQDRLHPPGARRAEDQARAQLAGGKRAGLGPQDLARGRHPARCAEWWRSLTDEQKNEEYWC